MRLDHFSVDHHRLIDTLLDNKKSLRTAVDTSETVSNCSPILCPQKRGIWFVCPRYPYRHCRYEWNHVYTIIILLYTVISRDDGWLLHVSVRSKAKVSLVRRTPLMHKPRAMHGTAGPRIMGGKDEGAKKEGKGSPKTQYFLLSSPFSQYFSFQSWYIDRCRSLCRFAVRLLHVCPFKFSEALLSQHCCLVLPWLNQWTFPANIHWCGVNDLMAGF